MTEEGVAPQARRDPAVPTGQPEPRPQEAGASESGVGRRDLRRAAVIAGSLVASGVPLGALWAGIAPRPDTAAVLDGTDAALTAQMGADVCFVVIMAVAGAVAGVLVWRFVREASWLVPLALAAGGCGGALVAGAVGAAVNSTVPGLAGVAGQLGDSLPRIEDLLDFGVRADSAYLVLALTSLVVFLVLSYVAGDRAGRRARAGRDAGPTPVGVSPAVSVPGPPPAVPRADDGS